MCRARYSHQLARSSAVRPAPAASAQQNTPISLPATAASPAARPSRTVRCRNSAVDGPGSAATARQASRNAGSTDRTCRTISLIRRLHLSPAESRPPAERGILRAPRDPRRALERIGQDGGGRYVSLRENHKRPFGSFGRVLIARGHVLRILRRGGYRLAERPDQQDFICPSFR